MPAGTTTSLEPFVTFASPQPNVLVRGTSVTVSGTASCERHTTDVNNNVTVTDAIDSIDKVEVRLGATGTPKLATATGPLNTATGKNRWSQWSCPNIPITGVVNDSLKITAIVTAGTGSTAGTKTNTYEVRVLIAHPRCWASPRRRI